MVTSESLAAMETEIVTRYTENAINFCQKARDEYESFRRDTDPYLVRNIFSSLDSKC